MPTHTRVCIVGGGITGTSTALHLAQDPHVQVHLYNTGQFPGGPCTSSHLDANHNQTSDAHSQPLLFNKELHSIATNDCGFIQRLRQANLVEWRPKRGWLANGVYRPAPPGPPHLLPSSCRTGTTHQEPLGCKTFVASEGLASLCSTWQQDLLGTGRMHVHQHCRVVGVYPAAPETSSRKWRVQTDNTPPEQPTTTTTDDDPFFDVVVFTDARMWLPHRNMQGIDPEINPWAGQWVRRQLRYDPHTQRFASQQALCTVLVAFKDTPASRSARTIQFQDIDTACVDDEQNILHYIVNQRCRHGVGSQGKPTDDGGGDDVLHWWWLVSTSSFAERCKDKEYKDKDIADSMVARFYNAMGMALDGQRPVVVYQRCQRWGGAYYTAPCEVMAWDVNQDKDMDKNQDTNKDETKDTAKSQDTNRDNNKDNKDKIKATHKATTQDTKNNDRRIGSAMLNHGAMWEICTAAHRPQQHVSASGSGLYCAGDYIYPGKCSGTKKRDVVVLQHCEF